MSRLAMFRNIGQRLQLTCELALKSSAYNIHCKPHLRSSKSQIGLVYTDEQVNQILQVLNEFTVEELTRFALSKRRATILASFRTENGKFYNLEQVFKLRTFGGQVLLKLCHSILDGSAPNYRDVKESCLDISSKTPTKGTRSRVQLVVPNMEECRRNSLASAVGVYVGLNVISWANIDRSSNVLGWDLFRLNADSKKVHPTSILETVFEARTKIPDSDVYVMEDASPLGQTAQQQITSLSLELHKSQLSAMLLAVLNTYTQSLDSVCPAVDPNSSESHHRVFYLRSRSTARLFRTLIGSERVSAQRVVQEILEPTGFSPVNIDHDIKSYYFGQINVDRENMCQSLLMAMAFMDLVVLQNPKSIKIVAGK